MTATGAPGRRLRARRGEGGQLRDQLVAATERLLATTGDEEAVSIRAIAEAVGVSPPAIYLHFPDKDALIFEVCAARFAELDQAIEAAAAGIDDPVAALLARGKAYVRFAVERAQETRAIGAQPGAIETAMELWAVAHGVASLLIGVPDFPWPDDLPDRVLQTYVRGLTSAAVSSS